MRACGVLAVLFVFVCLGEIGSCELDPEKEKDDRKEKYGTIIGIDLGTTYSWSVLCL